MKIFYTVDQGSGRIVRMEIAPEKNIPQDEHFVETLLDAYLNGGTIKIDTAADDSTATSSNCPTRSCR